MSVNNNAVRPGGAAPTTREAPAFSTKLVKLADVADDQKVVVKKDDTLWDIAAKHLGAKGNSAQIARLVEGIKKENPVISSPQRDGGNRIYPGDEIKIPQGNWAAAKPKTRQPTDAEAVVAAKAQNDANEVTRATDETKARMSLVKQLQGAITFVKGDPAVVLNQGQKNLVVGLLAQAAVVPGLGIDANDLTLLRSKAE